MLIYTFFNMYICDRDRNGKRDKERDVKYVTVEYPIYLSIQVRSCHLKCN